MSGNVSYEDFEELFSLRTGGGVLFLVEGIDSTMPVASSCA